MKRRLLNILIALDQMLYVLVTFGHGSPDEALSAAAWRWEMNGKWQGKYLRPFIDWLFSGIEKYHCYKSYEAERLKAHLPSEYR